MCQLYIVKETIEQTKERKRMRQVNISNEIKAILVRSVVLSVLGAWSIGSSYSVLAPERSRHILVYSMISMKKPCPLVYTNIYCYDYNDRKNNGVMQILTMFNMCMLVRGSTSQGKEQL